MLQRTYRRPSYRPPRARPGPTLRPPLRDPAERNALVERWLGIPKRVVRDWVKRGFNWPAHYPREDALSDATWGLFRAAELWEPDRVSRFTGRPVLFKSYAYASAWNAIRVGLGRAQSASLVHLSALDARDGPEGALEPEAATATDGPDPVEVDRLTDALLGLPERHWAVIDGSFRLGKTYASMGQELGVSRTRIGQIRREALEALASAFGERACQ